MKGFPGQCPAKERHDTRTLFGQMREKIRDARSDSCLNAINIQKLTTEGAIDNEETVISVKRHDQIGCSFQNPLQQLPVWPLNGTVIRRRADPGGGSADHRVSQFTEWFLGRRKILQRNPKHHPDYALRVINRPYGTIAKSVFFHKILEKASWHRHSKLERRGDAHP
jgi:hypothetical protein